MLIHDHYLDPSTDKPRVGREFEVPLFMGLTMGLTAALQQQSVLGDAPAGSSWHDPARLVGLDACSLLLHSASCTLHALAQRNSNTSSSTRESPWDLCAFEPSGFQRTMVSGQWLLGLARNCALSECRLYQTQYIATVLCIHTIEGACPVKRLPLPLLAASLSGSHFLSCMFVICSCVRL